MSKGIKGLFLFHLPEFIMVLLPFCSIVGEKLGHVSPALFNPCSLLFLIDSKKSQGKDILTQCDRVAQSTTCGHRRESQKVWIVITSTVIAFFVIDHSDDSPLRPIPLWWCLVSQALSVFLSTFFLCLPKHNVQEASNIQWKSLTPFQYGSTWNYEVITFIVGRIYPPLYHWWDFVNKWQIFGNSRSLNYSGTWCNDIIVYATRLILSAISDYIHGKKQCTLNLQ